MASNRPSEDGVEERVRRRLRELRTSLARYEHLAGLRLQRAQILKAEEAQLRVMERFRAAARNAVAAGATLDQLASELAASGALEDAVREVAETLGVARYKPLYEALDSIASSSAGDEERPAFLALQALARVYAEEYEAVRGPGSSDNASCPLCGSISDVAAHDGRSYYMVCTLCFYKWSLGREVSCPYCRSRDPLAIGLFMDQQRRVALAHCQECGSSWKIILDPGLARRAPRLVLPLIALAAEKYRGLTPGELGHG